MTLAQEINYDVKDMALAEQGKNNIEWAMKELKQDSKKSSPSKA